MKKKIWITWEEQPRNYSAANAVGAKLFVLTDESKRFLRYYRLALKTLAILKEEQPDTLFVQNPSIVLAITALFFRFWFRYILYIDAHNAGLYPLEGRSKFANYVCRLIACRTDFLIITNKHLSNITSSWGAKAIVLPDPLPELEPYLLDSRPPPPFKFNSGKINFFFVCTWSSDEPYEMLLSTFVEFSRTMPNLSLYISGNHKNKIDITTLSSNIHLTGFIPKSDYYQLFAACDYAIVLTTRENCLNCGAYEAVALEKPGVLSKTAALEEHFHKGFTFAGPEVDNISIAITDLLSGSEKHKRDIHDLKEVLKRQTKDIVSSNMF